MGDIPDGRSGFLPVDEHIVCRFRSISCQLVRLWVSRSRFLHDVLIQALLLHDNNNHSEHTHQQQQDGWVGKAEIAEKGGQEDRRIGR